MASTSNLCSNIPNHSSKLFTWTGKKGSCEASELGRTLWGRMVGELYGWLFTSVEDPEIQIYILND